MNEIKLMELLNYISHDFLYAIFAVIVTVLILFGVRWYGNIPNSSLCIDLNLLTYGFLWDVAIKAVREREYWPRFDESLLDLNKGTTLLSIALLNFVFMACNFKLVNKINSSKNPDGKIPLHVRMTMLPFVFGFGFASLIIFLFIQ